VLKEREAAPVRAELPRHHDTRNHAHAEIHGKDFRPVVVEIAIRFAPGLEPERLEHGEETREPDRDCPEDDVKADCETKLNAREDEGRRVRSIHARCPCLRQRVRQGRIVRTWRVSG